MKEVACDLREWGKMKYGSICEKVEQLKLEVKKMYEEKDGLELKLAKHNLDILQQKKEY